MSTQINIKGSTGPTGTAGGDLSGTYPNPTVDGLQGRPVSNATPVNGQVLQYDGINWVPGSIPSGGSGGGGVVYFLNFNTTADAPLTNITQTPNASKELGIISETTGTSYTSAILPTANYTLLASFVTDLNTPSSTTIPAGLWDFNIYAESTTSNVANQTSFQIEILKYDGSNAPVLLATSNEIYIYDPTEVTQYVASVIIPQTTILSTDRIVVYIYGKAHQNNKTLTFNFGGSYPSHVHSTIPSVTGTGIVKVINGVFQSPASTIVNADVSATAAIAVSKLSMATSRILGRTTASTGAVEEISLTTTGNSGSASLSSTNLNIPTYTLSGLDGVPTTRNITINGTTQDLSAGRTYTVTDANLSTSDVTTNDVSITKHGFVPKAPNDLAKYLRGDGTWAIIPSISLGRILFVATTGNDSTAIIGSLSNPYLTLEAAKSASTNGDLIYVYPGTYTVTTTDTEGLAKDGIGYYFSPKTIINKATSGPIFYADGFIYGFNVYGYGNFNKTTNTGIIFGSNNILVYGSVTTFGSLVGGTGYTTGSKATTGGSGTGLIVNVTSVGGTGNITALTISNAGSTYKVGDVITISGGATPATITVTEIASQSNTDADISFEANDILTSVASFAFDINTTARANLKFNNLLSTASSMRLDNSNVVINMYSMVSTTASVIQGNNGGDAHVQSSNLLINGYLIHSTSTAININTIQIGRTCKFTFNVNNILANSTTGYSFISNFGDNNIVLNVNTVSSIYGSAFLGDVYLNGYCLHILGGMNLYGGQVRTIGTSTIPLYGDVDTTYFGRKGNGGYSTIYISGGSVALNMTNQDFTAGFQITGGIVTLNGNWTNGEMGAVSSVVGGTLIINGDYSYGNNSYGTARYYGVLVDGGNLIVRGTIRLTILDWGGFDVNKLFSSPIELNNGKVILNSGTLISNAPMATPIRVTNNQNAVNTFGTGTAGTLYTNAIRATTAVTGSGTGLTVQTANVNGITGTIIVNRGTGYAVGDIITIVGGGNNATFPIATVMRQEVKVYTGGLNTNLIQHGGTLAAKKLKFRANLTVAANTQIVLNDNISSGNLTFLALVATYPTTAELAAQIVAQINASTIQITATQDSPGDSYFYLEADTNYTFTTVSFLNLTTVAITPASFPISPTVLGPIIEDINVE